MAAEDIEGVSHNGVRRIYRVLCHLAWCDDDVAEKERGFLKACQTRFQIPASEAAVIEEEGRAGQGLGVGKRPAERQMMMETMIDVTMIDGVLSKQEQERLVKFGVTFGLTAEELAAQIVARAKTVGKKMKPEG